MKTKGDRPLLNSLRTIYKREVYFFVLFLNNREYLVFGEDILCLFQSLRKQFYAQCTNHPMYILIDINSLYSLTHFVPAITSSISQVCTCLITSPIDRFRTQYWAKYEMNDFY